MITLTTDFGSSEYVGAMKGVIYSINPEAVVVDITHNIRPFDIRHGAYAIYSTAFFFPEKTAHLVVVDPGVGTGRKGIIIKSGGHFFIGPDNGVFSLIDAEEVYQIGETSASSTFHGRDIFAPAAAKIDKGRHPENLGRRIKNIESIGLKEIVVSDRIVGEVLCVDHFGNVITTIKKKHTLEYGIKTGDKVKVSIAGGELEAPVVRTYGEMDRGRIALLINSADHLEISLREADAGGRLEIKGGEPVEVFR